MNLIRHRGDGIYLESGWVNTPCALNSAEFGNHLKCKSPRAPLPLT